MAYASLTATIRRVICARHNHFSEQRKTAAAREPSSKKRSNQRLMETGKVLNLAIALLLWRPNALDAV